MVTWNTKSSSSRGWTTTTRMEPDESCPKKLGHLQNRGETGQVDGRGIETLCSEQFIVPGAQNINRVLRASNFKGKVQGALNFLEECLGH